MTFTDLVQSINSSIYIMPLSAAQAGFFVFFPKKNKKEEKKNIKVPDKHQLLHLEHQHKTSEMWSGPPSNRHTQLGLWFWLKPFGAPLQQILKQTHTHTHKEEVTSLGIFKKLKMLVLQVVFI